MSEPLTVGALQKALIDLPPTFDHHPTRDAVVQVTSDGEQFYAIESIDDYGDGGVVLQVVPWPASAPLTDQGGER